jgi:hypothetical protein
MQWRIEPTARLKERDAVGMKNLGRLLELFAGWFKVVLPIYNKQSLD